MSLDLFNDASPMQRLWSTETEDVIEELERMQNRWIGRDLF